MARTRGSVTADRTSKSSGAALRLQELDAVKLLVEAFKDWIRDRCEGLAAALAFHAILSVPAFVAMVAFTVAVIIEST